MDYISRSQMMPAGFHGATAMVPGFAVSGLRGVRVSRYQTWFCSP